MIGAKKRLTDYYAVTRVEGQYLVVKIRYHQQQQLLDHAEVISEDKIAEKMSSIAQNPDAQLVYWLGFDEVKTINYRLDSEDDVTPQTFTTVLDDEFGLDTNQYYWQVFFNEQNRDCLYYMVRKQDLQRTMATLEVPLSRWQHVGITDVAYAAMMSRLRKTEFLTAFVYLHQDAVRVYLLRDAALVTQRTFPCQGDDHEQVVQQVDHYLQQMAVSHHVCILGEHPAMMQAWPKFQHFSLADCNQSVGLSVEQNLAILPIIFAGVDAYVRI